MRVTHASLSAAEYFRDASYQDVLLFIDNVLLNIVAQIQYPFIQGVLLYYGQEDETYTISGAHGYFGRLIFQYARSVALGSTDGLCTLKNHSLVI